MQRPIHELKEEMDAALERIQGTVGKARMDATMRWNAAKKEYNTAQRIKNNPYVPRRSK